MQLTKDFDLDEFISEKDWEVPTVKIVNNLKNLANRLQVIRDLLERPIYINSGFRSLGYNEQIGGATNSYHIKGMAADIVVEGMSPAKVQQFLQNWSGGLGAYETFTHIDIRNEKARWNG